MGAYARHYKDGGWKGADVKTASVTTAGAIIADPGDGKHIVIVGVSSQVDTTLYAGTSGSDPVICHYNEGWTDAAVSVSPSTAVYSDGSGKTTVFYYIDGLVNGS